MNSVNSDTIEYIFVETKDTKTVSSSGNIEKPPTDAASSECSEVVSTCTIEDDSIVLEIEDEIEDDAEYQKWGLDKSSYDAMADGIYAASAPQTTFNIELKNTTNVPSSLPNSTNVKLWGQADTASGTIYICQYKDGTFGCAGSKLTASGISERQDLYNRLQNAYGYTIIMENFDGAVTENKDANSQNIGTVAKIYGTGTENTGSTSKNTTTKETSKTESDFANKGLWTKYLIEKDNQTSYDLSGFTPIDENDLPERCRDFGVELDDALYQNNGIVQYYKIQCGIYTVYAALNANGMFGAIYDHYDWESGNLTLTSTTYWDLQTLMENLSSDIKNNYQYYTDSLANSSSPSTEDTSSQTTNKDNSNNPFGKYAVAVEVAKMSDANLKSILQKATGKNNATVYQIDAYQTQWGQIDVYVYQNTNGKWCCYPSLNGQTEFNSINDIAEILGYNLDYKDTQTNTENAAQAAWNTDDADEHQSYYPEEDLKCLEALLGPDFAPAAITTGDGATRTIGVCADGTSAIVIPQTTSTTLEDGTTTTQTTYTVKTYSSIEDLEAQNQPAYTIGDSVNDAGKWLLDNQEKANEIIGKFQDSLKGYSEKLEELRKIDNDENQNLIKIIQRIIDNCWMTLGDINYENQNYDCLTQFYNSMQGEFLTKATLNDILDALDSGNDDVFSLNLLDSLFSEYEMAIERKETKDGEIGSSKQQSIGDCWLLSGINALSYTEIGKNYISNILDYRANYTVVHLNIGDIEVTNQEVINACYKAGYSYSKGDMDMLILELAVEKTRDKILSGEITINSSNSAISNKSRIERNTDGSEAPSITGGHTNEAFAILTGRGKMVYSKWSYDSYLNDFIDGKCALTATINSDGDSHYTTVKDAYGNDTNLPTCHCYAVKSADKDTVTVINPWNSDEEIVLSRSTFKKTFSNIGVMAFSDSSASVDENVVHNTDYTETKFDSNGNMSSQISHQSTSDGGYLEIVVDYSSSPSSTVKYTRYDEDGNELSTITRVTPSY